VNLLRKPCLLQQLSSITSHLLQPIMSMSMSISMSMAMGMTKMEKRQLRPWKDLGVTAKIPLENPRAWQLLRNPKSRAKLRLSILVNSSLAF
jgi:hypothetical protein